MSQAGHSTTITLSKSPQYTLTPLIKFNAGRLKAVTVSNQCLDQICTWESESHSLVKHILYLFRGKFLVVYATVVVIDLPMQASLWLHLLCPPVGTPFH